MVMIMAEDKKFLAEEELDSVSGGTAAEWAEIRDIIMHNPTLKAQYDEYKSHIPDEKIAISGVVGYYTGVGMGWHGDADAPNAYDRGIKSHEEVCALLRKVK
jgi:hypothetical protein